jgi:hypothetical protein
LINVIYSRDYIERKELRFIKNNLIFKNWKT